MNKICEDMEQNTVKRIPYGIQDFVQVIEQNSYYVDKTMYIPKLEEEPNNLFFIRPRRFGKSVFLSMLHAYYDIRTKDKFQQWFGDLWIGKHPTPLQGRYQILHLDFSQVGGIIEKLEENFNFYLGMRLDGFINVYSEYYSEETKEKIKSTDYAGGKLGLIQQEAQIKGYPLYLIIDEYDNFTNTVLNEQGEHVYWAITHAEGFYRDIFKKFKGSFERIFITGVSPVTLDDVTSGFNIGWHISTKEEFNQMMGFSTEEVHNMLVYYQKVGTIPSNKDIEAMLNEMKHWYANYCFSNSALKEQSCVFNCDMVLHYLNGYINNGSAPKEMVDNYTITELKNLFPSDKYAEFRKDTIRQLVSEGIIRTTIVDTYSIYELLKPDHLASLLFYKGVLTISGTFGSMSVLSIPNKNNQELYGKVFQEIMEK